jgi:hypothetical protein
MSPFWVRKTRYIFARKPPVAVARNGTRPVYARRSCLRGAADGHDRSFRSTNCHSRRGHSSREALCVRRCDQALGNPPDITVTVPHAALPVSVGHVGDFHFQLCAMFQCLLHGGIRIFNV